MEVDIIELSNSSDYVSVSGDVSARAATPAGRISIDVDVSHAMQKSENLTTCIQMSVLTLS